ncbi:hypothetical protein MLD38_001572 [Melastoma candidum]|uniref:Uncharacterized protein n=1 Tax=Melastoma candidum TaxID=119954 RepID=A0ACB9SDK9_9MYRT|nr:hypothetical protein MLD38_001572 [Melastoma candidum]
MVMVEPRDTRNDMKMMKPELKKGAWTEEEDALLRNCIDRHGEGKWYLVPLRAGLNRCRRSCRLRWLNYLKPNIKRGDFEDDEVDLVIRLHNLLGNRWSLIAGRIPGRTANDVKNYWNTRLARKILLENNKPRRRRTKRTARVEVIKPHPRTFSRSTSWLNGKATLITCPALRLDNRSIDSADKPAPLPLETEALAAWWEGLSGDTEDLDRPPTPEGLRKESLVSELLAETSKTAEGSLLQDKEWDVVSFDIDLWQHSDTTPQRPVE